MAIKKQTLGAIAKASQAISAYMVDNSDLHNYDIMNREMRLQIYSVDRLQELERRHVKLEALRRILDRALSVAIKEWFTTQNGCNDIMVISIGTGTNKLQSDSWGRGTVVLNIEAILTLPFKMFNSDRVTTLEYRLGERDEVEKTLQQCVARALQRGKKIILQDYCGSYGVTLMENPLLMRHVSHLGKNLCFIAGWEDSQPLIKYKAAYFALSEEEKSRIGKLIYSLPQDADQQAIQDFFPENHADRQYIDVYSSIPNSSGYYTVPVNSLFVVQSPIENELKSYIRTRERNGNASLFFKPDPIKVSVAKMMLNVLKKEEVSVLHFKKLSYEEFKKAGKGTFSHKLKDLMSMFVNEERVDPTLQQTLKKYSYMLRLEEYINSNKYLKGNRKLFLSKQRIASSLLDSLKNNTIATLSDEQFDVARNGRFSSLREIIDDFMKEEELGVNYLDKPVLREAQYGL